MKQAKAVYSKLAIARVPATIACIWQGRRAGRGTGELQSGERGAAGVPWSGLRGCWRWTGYKAGHAW